MMILIYILTYVFLVWLLVTKVRDGFTYVPIVGMGLGFLAGREIAAILGEDWNSLPWILGLVLLVAPFALLMVVSRPNTKEVKAPDPEERAKLEAAIDWQEFNPEWLVKLATEQYPEDKELIEGLTQCKRTFETLHMVYFISPSLLDEHATPKWLLLTSDNKKVTIYRTKWREIAAYQILDS